MCFNCQNHRINPFEQGNNDELTSGKSVKTLKKIPEDGEAEDEFDQEDDELRTTVSRALSKLWLGPEGL